MQGSIDLWAAHYGVDRHLARAIAWKESGYHTGVVSAVGAWGVMQVMPDTWRFVEGLIGHEVPRTPDGNIRIGVAYIHHLLIEFGGNERLALAAYYQGPAGVRTFGLLPVSELYVANVLALRYPVIAPRNASARASRWVSTDAQTASQSANTRASCTE